MNRARRAFAASNLRLVLLMARRFRRIGFLPFEDLVQEGNIGLMLAVDRFDPRRGLRFSTYAMWWIRHAITRALSDRGRVVRLPVHVIERRSKVEKFKATFAARNRRDPTMGEVAEGTGIAEGKLEQLGHVMVQQSESRSPDVAHAVDPIEAIASASDDPDAALDMAAAGAILCKGMAQLAPIEREILRLRFGLGDDPPKTLREVGALYSLSRERIRQLQNRGLGKLRASLLQAGHASAPVGASEGSESLSFHTACRTPILH